MVVVAELADARDCGSRTYGIITHQSPKMNGRNQYDRFKKMVGAISIHSMKMYDFSWWLWESSCKDNTKRRKIVSNYFVLGSPLLVHIPITIQQAIRETL